MIKLLFNLSVFFLFLGMYFMATPLGLALENSQKIDLISHPTHFPIKAYRIHYKGSFSQIRQGLLLLPENQDNKPLPSLVYLHGHGSSA